MAVKRRKIKSHKPENRLARSEKELKSELRPKAKRRTIKSKTREKKKLQEDNKKQKLGNEEKARLEKYEQIDLSPEEIVMLEEKVERQKRFIMWSGVTFFMVLIAGIWIYNAKSIFQASSQTWSNSDDVSLDNWNEMANDLGNKISEMQDDLENIRTNAASSTEDATASLPAGEDKTAQPDNSDVNLDSNGPDAPGNNAEIEALKERLEELELKDRDNR